MKIKLKTSDSKNLFNVLLEKRFSCRDFQNKMLDLDDLAALLWAACGKKYDSVTGATRTIPSAGATNPLELYLIVGKASVSKLKEGLYHYLIEEHALELLAQGDKRQELTVACLGQSFLNSAPVSLIICAQFERTTRRYGDRGKRYVYMEAGHASQNTYLAAAHLGLGIVEVGAFLDDKLRAVLGLESDHAHRLPQGITVGKIKKHSPVKLIIGLIFKESGPWDKAKKALEKRFGEVDFESTPLDFNHTDYYEKEMGEDLKKVFISFKKLILPQGIAKAKIETNKIENRLMFGKKRTINIDPGYLELSKLVLATTKDFRHRIYLGHGIFAEVTLFYANNTFRAWEWTYPDYKSKAYIHIFNKIRGIYAGQIKNA